MSGRLLPSGDSQDGDHIIIGSGGSGRPIQRWQATENLEVSRWDSESPRSSTGSIGQQPMHRWGNMTDLGRDGTGSVVSSRGSGSPTYSAGSSAGSSSIVEQEMKRWDNIDLGRDGSGSSNGSVSSSGSFKEREPNWGPRIVLRSDGSVVGSSGRGLEQLRRQERWDNTSMVRDGTGLSNWENRSRSQSILEMQMERWDSIDLGSPGQRWQPLSDQDDCMSLSDLDDEHIVRSIREVYDMTPFAIQEPPCCGDNDEQVLVNRREVFEIEEPPREDNACCNIL